MKNAGAEFWLWLESRLPRLERVLAGERDDALLDEVSRRVAQLHGASLGWEIGPGIEKPHLFVLSPKGDPEKLKVSRELVKQSPPTAEWEFFHAKPPKQWRAREIQLTRKGRLLTLSFDRWTYQLTAFAAREFFDIDLYPPEPLADDVYEELDTLAYLFVEGELGEELLIDRIDRINAHRTPRPGAELTAVRFMRRHLASLLAGGGGADE